MVDGKARMKVVRTGASNLSETMILEGLADGETVVTGPYRVLERLKDGDAIREEVAKDMSEPGQKDA
jgi:HlyD family secretion protein